jgi:hypothetical protein
MLGILMSKTSSSFKSRNVETNNRCHDSIGSSRDHVRGHPIVILACERTLTLPLLPRCGVTIDRTGLVLPCGVGLWSAGKYTERT